MRSLGELRLPSLRPAEFAAPVKSNAQRSLDYTWSSVLCEIPNLGRKRAGAKSKQQEAKPAATSLRQARQPRTPKTPRSVKRVGVTSQSAKSAARSSNRPAKTPRMNDIKCRHKSNISCPRCRPSADERFMHRTPRPTASDTMHYVTRVRGDMTPLQLRLPPIKRAYSVATLRKQKENVKDFMDDLRGTFPRRSKAAGAPKYNPAGNPVRRSRSVNSITDHVSRLTKTRSYQQAYGATGPNIPLHLSRSHSVNSLQSYRSRSRQRGSITTRSGRRSRSQSHARNQQQLQSGSELRQSRPRSRSVSNSRVLMSSRGTSRTVTSRDGTRAAPVGVVARQQSRESVRSRTQKFKSAMLQQHQQHRSTSKSRSGPILRRSSVTTRQRIVVPVVVRLTKTPSAPDIYRTTSRASLASNDGRRKQLPLYMAIKPENQKLEKEKFFRSNFSYCPNFLYAAPASDSQLQKYSRASDRLLHLVSLVRDVIS